MTIQLHVCNYGVPIIPSRGLPGRLMVAKLLNQSDNFETRTQRSWKKLLGDLAGTYYNRDVVASQCKKIEEISTGKT